MLKLKDTLKKALGDELLEGEEGMNYGAYSPNGVRAIIILKDLIFIDYHKGYPGNHTIKEVAGWSPAAWSLSPSQVMLELPKGKALPNGAQYDPVEHCYYRDTAEGKEIFAIPQKDGALCEFRDREPVGSSYSDLLKLLTAYKNFFTLEEILVDENLGINIDDYKQPEGSRLRRIGYVSRDAYTSGITNETLGNMLTQYRREAEQVTPYESLFSDFFTDKSWEASNPRDTDHQVYNTEGEGEWFRKHILAPKHYSSDIVGGKLYKHFLEATKTLSAKHGGSNASADVSPEQVQVLDAYVSAILKDTKVYGEVEELFTVLQRDSQQNNGDSEVKHLYATHVLNILTGGNHGRLSPKYANTPIPMLRWAVEQCLGREYYATQNQGNNDTAKLQEKYGALDQTYIRLGLYNPADANKNGASFPILNENLAVLKAEKEKTGILHPVIFEALYGGIILIAEDARQKGVQFQATDIIAEAHPSQFTAAYESFLKRISNVWDDPINLIINQLNEALRRIITSTEAREVAGILKRLPDDVQTYLKPRVALEIGNNKLPYIDELEPFKNNETWAVFKEYNYGETTSKTPAAQSVTPTEILTNYFTPGAILARAAIKTSPSEVYNKFNIEQWVEEPAIGTEEKTERIRKIGALIKRGTQIRQGNYVANTREGQ